MWQPLTVAQYSELGRVQKLVHRLEWSSFAALGLALSVGFAGVAGLWIWAKVVVVPFLLFCQVIGWLVYVHHISPEIRWWPRADWNRFRGQVEGTTVLWGRRGWDIFLHWIMVHLPHHVDMRIPCYRLPEAARAITAEFPDDVEQGCWLGYADVP